MECSGGWMGMLMARMAMRMRMRHILVFMKMAMDKIVSFKKREVFQYLLRATIPDLSFILPHHHKPVRDLRNDVDILSRRNDGAALIAELTHGINKMSRSPGVQAGCRLIQKDYLRLHYKNGGNGYPLLLPYAQLLRMPLQ